MALPTSCPRCGAPVRRGTIVGQMKYLTWVPEGERPPRLTVLGSEHLATGSLTRSPALVAARCTACGLGVFETGQQGRTSTS